MNAYRSVSKQTILSSFRIMLLQKYRDTSYLNGTIQAMPSRSAIIVFGDVNADIIARVRAWPNPGEECLTDHVELHCGGVAANCAIALARWKVSPTLIAQVGQ